MYERRWTSFERKARVQISGVPQKDSTVLYTHTQYIQYMISNILYPRFKFQIQGSRPCLRFKQLQQFDRSSNSGRKSAGRTSFSVARRGHWAGWVQHFGGSPQFPSEILQAVCTLDWSEPIISGMELKSYGVSIQFPRHSCCKSHLPTGVAPRTPRFASPGGLLRFGRVESRGRREASRSQVDGPRETGFDGHVRFRGRFFFGGFFVFRSFRDSFFSGCRWCFCRLGKLGKVGPFALRDILRRAWRAELSKCNR